MSRIDELIEELCPNGVLKMELGEICRVMTGQNISKAMISKNPGEFPVINSGREPLGFFASFNVEDDPIGIASRGSVGLVTWTPGKFFRGNLNYGCTVKDPNALSARFLFHVLLESDREIQALSTHQGIPALNATALRTLRISVPPIEVQREIVSILDKFTQLEAELEAELDARRKQLEYLSNSEIERALAEPGTRAVALSEVADVFDGVHATPAYTDSGIRFVSVEDIDNLYDSRKFISEEDFSKFRKSPEIGDLLMTRIGSIGTCAVVDRDELLAYYVSLALIKPKPGIVNSEYLKILFESPIGIAALRTKSLTHAVPIKINLGDLRSLVIPVPSVSTQDKLVQKILPAQQLVKDLTIGLPAEIAARRKQYEYYRNKLLTFKELEAA